MELGDGSGISTRLMRLIYSILAGISFAAASDTVELAFAPEAFVNDTAIFLSDIASIHGASAELAGRLAATGVGRSAPPGFSRFMSSSDAVRYCIQKRFPSLSFTVKGPERIKITTDSRILKLVDFKNDVDSYLKRNIKWPENMWRVVLIDSDAVARCFNRPIEVSVDGLQDPYSRGSIQLQLRVIQDNFTLTIPFNCRIYVTSPVVVARQSIQRGEKITPDHIEISTRDITVLRYNPISGLDAVQNMVASRAISAGAIIHEKMLRPVPAVLKGDLVYVTAQRGAVKISVPVRAREEGGIGERIWVENSESNRIFKVTITGKGQAVISSGEAI